MFGFGRKKTLLELIDGPFRHMLFASTTDLEDHFARLPGMAGTERSVMELFYLACFIGLRALLDAAPEKRRTEADAARLIEAILRGICETRGKQRNLGSEQIEQLFTQGMKRLREYISGWQDSEAAMFIFLNKALNYVQPMPKPSAEALAVHANTFTATASRIAARLQAKM